MAKYKFIIKRVEYYREEVVVEADNQNEAEERLMREWEEDDYLYEKTTECMVDSETNFEFEGPATEVDVKYLINIE